MIEAFCVCCGRDCTHANATYKGDIYCFACLPMPKKPKPKPQLLELVEKASRQPVK